MAERRSKETASASPKSAAHYVRRGAEAIRSRYTLGLCEGVCPSLYKAERQALIQWAEARGALLTEDFLRSFSYTGYGAEHRVYHDECNKLAIKATHPNRFGHSTTTPRLGATPAEYLRRLAWCNVFFGDEIRVLGVICDEEQIQVVSSQPWIADNKKDPPSGEEIAAYFAEFGFLPVSENPETPVFYSPEFNLLVADAHDTNVIRSRDGGLAQIDVVVGAPGPEAVKEFNLERFTKASSTS